MKTKNLVCCIMILWMASVTKAQSDYETVMSFKKEYHNIEESIKNATSLEEFDSIGKKILNLRSKYASSGLLLDKALYPENYQSSFEKIDNLFENKKKDYSQITTLSVQVGSLQSQLTELSNKNESLLRQINELVVKTEKDQSEIAELKRLVAKLKGNINQRDMLVRDLVDSLLVEFNKMPEKINQKEGKTIISKVIKGNLFYNIERTIDDNIQFLKVTRMTADDFGKNIKQYKDFNKLWKQIGPKLNNVYNTKKQKIIEVHMIDSLFTEWENQIHVSIWTEILNIFREKNIKLATFNDANSFLNSTISFIDREIKNAENKTRPEAEEVYHSFTDNVYYQTVEIEWIPLLMENHMLKQNEKDILDAKIEMWKKELDPALPYWGFILIGGIIILLAAIYIFKKNMRSVEA